MKKFLSVICIMVAFVLVIVSSVSLYELNCMRDDRSIKSSDGRCEIQITRNKNFQSVHASIYEDEILYTVENLFTTHSFIEVYFSPISYDFFVYSTDEGISAYIFDKEVKNWNGEYYMIVDGDKIKLWDPYKQAAILYDENNIPEDLITIMEEV